jgi:hypothetical protein
MKKKSSWLLLIGLLALIAAYFWGMIETKQEYEQDEPTPEAEPEEERIEVATDKTEPERQPDKNETVKIATDETNK